SIVEEFKEEELEVTTAVKDLFILDKNQVLGCVEIGNEGKNMLVALSYRNAVENNT
ncbi:hypothetical protein PanWU01x14_206110, partial [Parasponia andersonii]